MRYLALLTFPILAIFVLRDLQAAKPNTPMTWDQWRGPLRNGEAPGQEWPNRLDGLKSVWRIDLDKGYSTPIVAADRVFTTETANGDTETVRALDRTTGKELWRHELPRPATATPMTYRTKSGKQIVVIATGRGEDTALVAFALP